MKKLLFIIFLSFSFYYHFAWQDGYLLIIDDNTGQWSILLAVA